MPWTPSQTLLLDCLRGQASTAFASMLRGCAVLAADHTAALLVGSAFRCQEPLRWLILQMQQHLASGGGWGSPLLERNF